MKNFKIVYSKNYKALQSMTRLNNDKLEVGYNMKIKSNKTIFKSKSRFGNAFPTKKF